MVHRINGKMESRTLPHLGEDHRIEGEGIGDGTKEDEKGGRHAVRGRERGGVEREDTSRKGTARGRQEARGISAG